MGVLQEYDGFYLQAALGELEDYLLSQDLFWQLKGAITPDRTTFPQLTVGTLLLSLNCIRASQNSFPDEARLIRLENELQTVKAQWRFAWNMKVGREFTSRLRQWGNYLGELMLDPEEYSPYYGFEVRWRVVLELLKDEIDEIDPENLELLLTMDSSHRQFLNTGKFIWEEELIPGFDQQKYWYLWGNLG